jgi:hypothetical protein
MRSQKVRSDEATETRDSGEQLHLIIRKRFASLSQAELTMIKAAGDGEIAFCGPSHVSDDAGNNPQYSDGWGNQRSIRADILRFLCTDREVARFVDPRGLRVHGAKIAGTLDLSYVPVPYPLHLLRCTHDAVEVVTHTLHVANGDFETQRTRE